MTNGHANPPETKLGKLALGALSFWPAVYAAAAAALWLTGRSLPARVHAANALFLIALVVFFLRHLGRAPMGGARRARWQILLLLGSAAVAPLYWLRFVWREGR